MDKSRKIYGEVSSEAIPNMPFNPSSMKIDFSDIDDGRVSSVAEFLALYHSTACIRTTSLQHILIGTLDLIEQFLFSCPDTCISKVYVVGKFEPARFNQVSPLLNPLDNVIVGLADTYQIALSRVKALEHVIILGHDIHELVPRKPTFRAINVGAKLEGSLSLANGKYYTPLGWGAEGEFVDFGTSVVGTDGNVYPKAATTMFSGRVLPLGVFVYFCLQGMSVGAQHFMSLSLLSLVDEHACDLQPRAWFKLVRLAQWGIRVMMCYLKFSKVPITYKECPRWLKSLVGIFPSDIAPMSDAYFVRAMIGRGECIENHERALSDDIHGNQTLHLSKFLALLWNLFAPVYTSIVERWGTKRPFQRSATHFGEFVVQALTTWVTGDCTVLLAECETAAYKMHRHPLEGAAFKQKAYYGLEGYLGEVLSYDQFLRGLAKKDGWHQLVFLFYKSEYANSAEVTSTAKVDKPIAMASLGEDEFPKPVEAEATQPHMKLPKPVKESTENDWSGPLPLKDYQKLVQFAFKKSDKLAAQRLALQLRSWAGPQLKYADMVLVEDDLPFICIYDKEQNTNFVVSVPKFFELHSPNTFLPNGVVDSHSGSDLPNIAPLSLGQSWVDNGAETVGKFPTSRGGSARSGQKTGGGRGRKPYARQ
jgi:hypothetical protein